MRAIGGAITGLARRETLLYLLMALKSKSRDDDVLNVLKRSPGELPFRKKSGRIVEDFERKQEQALIHVSFMTVCFHNCIFLLDIVVNLSQCFLN